MFRTFFFNRILAILYKALLTTNLKCTELDLSSSKCLCLAPHADDESIGMGGTLAKYNKQFDIICVTDGYRGVSEPDLTREEKAEVRKNELYSAMNKIDISNVNFIEEIPDRNLILNNEIFQKIDISNYDYIFIPNILDAHRDHKAVSILLKELLRRKKYKKTLKIVFYEVWSTLAAVNAFVDIEDFKNVKRDLISTYASQLKEYNYIDKALALNTYRGLPLKKEIAEAFFVADISLFKKLCKIYYG